MPKAPLSIAVAREAGDWPAGFDALAERAVRAALALSGARVTGTAELSILLTDDAAQRALNRQWRGKDAPTNVLSFPQIEPFGPLAGLVGDISLARETLVREAGDLEVPLEAHFSHLVVHGFLHILGYDHQSEPEALQMEGLETKIMASLGYPDPYGADAGANPRKDLRRPRAAGTDDRYGKADGPRARTEL